MHKGNSKIQQYRENSRDRHYEKIREVLIWLYRHGWSHEHIIQKLLKLKRRPCSYLNRAGVLKRVEPEAGFRTAYVIGSAYLELAQSMHEERTGLALPYSQHRTLIPWYQLGKHSEICQLAALAELEADDGVYHSEREWRHMAQAGEAIPDFSIARGEDGFWWYEVERTPKYHERLVFQLRERHVALTAGKFDKLIWICKSEGIMRNLLKALEAPTLPHVRRRADGKIVRVPDEEGWNPEQLLAASEFRIWGADIS